MITLVAIALLIYLALCAALFAFQRSMIYLPQPRSAEDTAPTITLSAQGAEVRVTTRPLPGPDALIYFGGNAEDVSYSLPDLAAAFPKRALYLMHYRGYGGSTGKPTETALVADAVALFDKVQAEHKNVVVVGRSLGSGVAIQLAGLRPVARLVLVTPYDSIEELAAQQFRYFPVRWLLLDKFDSGKVAPRITAPTLLIVAEHDEVIPRASTEALFKRFRPQVATMSVVAGVGHNTISQSPDYLALLRGQP
ncbi:MAG TPA: alpha/beta fold hydrolase [Burkholderiaceae bacterium]